MNDLRDLELLVQAAALGSLTKAAVKLDLTQSAASRRIAALEERLGGRLFHRTGRGVHPTELGASVLPRIEALLNDADRIASDARARAGKPVGTVRLGVLPSVSRPFIGMLYRETMQRLPAVRLQIDEAFGGLLDEAIANGTVDLAILNRYGHAPPDGEELLARVDMCVIGSAGDRLTRHGRVAFKELDGLPLLLPSAPNAWRGVLEKTARRHGIRLHESMVVDSVSLLADVVAGGGCHAIVPGYAVEREVAEGLLQVARIVQPAMTRLVTLSVTSQRPMTIAAREVARLVRGLLPRMLGEVGAGTRVRPRRSIESPGRRFEAP